MNPKIRRDELHESLTKIPKHLRETARFTSGNGGQVFPPLQAGEGRGEVERNSTRVPFFSDSVNIARLQTTAQSWLNTPFFPHGKIKGAGVDCVHLCAEIYKECGLWSDYQFPKYTLDGGPHAGSSLVIEWLEKHQQFEKLVDVNAYALGDLHCFRIGKNEWHVGIQITGAHFIHCWRKLGVNLSLLSDPTYASRRTAIYRPLKTEH